MNVDDVPLIVDCTLQVNVELLPVLIHPCHETYSSVVMFAAKFKNYYSFEISPIRDHLVSLVNCIFTCIWPSCVTPGDNE